MDCIVHAIDFLREDIKVFQGFQHCSLEVQCSLSFDPRLPKMMMSSVAIATPENIIPSVALLSSIYPSQEMIYDLD